MEQTRKKSPSNSILNEPPESRQVLHAPQQYLLVSKDRSVSIAKLRPIDTVLAIIHKLTSTCSETTLHSLMVNEFELSRLFGSMQSALKIG
jgi:hypothetical protein